VIAVVGRPDLTAPAVAMLEEELRRRPTGFARADKAGVVRAGRYDPAERGAGAGARRMAAVEELS